MTRLNRSVVCRGHCLVERLVVEGIYRLGLDGRTIRTCLYPFCQSNLAPAPPAPTADDDFLATQRGHDAFTPLPGPELPGGPHATRAVPKQVDAPRSPDTRRKEPRLRESGG